MLLCVRIAACHYLKLIQAIIVNCNKLSGGILFVLSMQKGLQPRRYFKCGLLQAIFRILV